MSISRRTALGAVLVGLGTATTRGWASVAQGTRRIGFLTARPAPPPGPSGLARNLKAYGFEEGRNLVIERRYAAGAIGKLPALGRELISAGAELIVAAGNEAIAAAQGITRTVPVVMAYGIAPVEAGFVRSLAQPGGNITGNAFYTPETLAKMFDVLREVAPKARRVVMIWNPARPGYGAFRKILENVAERLSVALEFVGVMQPSEVPAALESVEKLAPEMLLVSNDMSLENDGRRIADFARRRRLPSFGTVPDWVDNGGFLYHGPDEGEAFAGTVRFVARILGGSRPQDLPAEQPSTFRLHLNAETARIIGLAIPDSIRIRADRVVG